MQYKISIFIEDDSDAILLVGAGNPFNRINRNVTLHNFRNICPLIAAYALNPYSRGDRLFISRGEEITSPESSTKCVATAVFIHVQKQVKIAQNMLRMKMIYAL